MLGRAAAAHDQRQRQCRGLLLSGDAEQWAALAGTTACRPEQDTTPEVITLLLSWRSERLTVAPSATPIARMRSSEWPQSAASGVATGNVWLLRVEVGDDGEDATVVVCGLWEAQGAEDVLDVFLDGVLGDDEAFGDRVV